MSAISSGSTAPTKSRFTDSATPVQTSSAPTHTGGFAGVSSVPVPTSSAPVQSRFSDSVIPAGKTGLSGVVVSASIGVSAVLSPVQQQQPTSLVSRFTPLSFAASAPAPQPPGFGSSQKHADSTAAQRPVLAGGPVPPQSTVTATSATKADCSSAALPIAQFVSAATSRDPRLTRLQSSSQPTSATTQQSQTAVRSLPHLLYTTVPATSSQQQQQLPRLQYTSSPAAQSHPPSSAAAPSVAGSAATTQQQAAAVQSKASAAGPGGTTPVRGTPESTSAGVQSSPVTRPASTRQQRFYVLNQMKPICHEAQVRFT